MTNNLPAALSSNQADLAIDANRNDGSSDQAASSGGPDNAPAPSQDFLSQTHEILQGLQSQHRQLLLELAQESARHATRSQSPEIVAERDQIGDCIAMLQQQITLLVNGIKYEQSLSQTMPYLVLPLEAIPAVSQFLQFWPQTGILPLNSLRYFLVIWPECQNPSLILSHFRSQFVTHPYRAECHDFLGVAQVRHCLLLVARVAQPRICLYRLSLRVNK